MRLKTKYVVIDDVRAILFNESFQHQEFSHFGKITGAGFVSFGMKGGHISVSVYGESVSLGIKSKEEDLYAIKGTLGLQYT